MPGYRETLHKIMDGGYDGATEEEKRQAIRNVIQMGAVASGALTVQPIPFVDSALIAPVQIAMVQAIGRIHGYRLDRKSVIEILSTFGASIVAQNLAMGAAKFVPVLGWAMAISMAYALTWAIGEVSDHYFRSGRGVEPASLRSMFKRVYKEKRAEKEATNRGNSTLKDKLEQLTEAFRSGLLNEAEFNAKKEELLRSF
jgi:uncharacterized protein (DUF697 family)